MTDLQELMALADKLDADGLNSEAECLYCAVSIATKYSALRSPAFAEMQANARRYEWLRSKATQKTAYDVFGDGGHWTVGVHSNDNRLTLDAAIDAAASGGA